MAEPDKPQAASVMLDVAQAFAADAEGQARSCEQGARLQKDMQQAIDDLAVFLRAQGNAATADALNMIGRALGGVGTILELAKERLDAHVHGWEREAGVWRQVVEKSTEKPAPAGGGGT